MKTVKVIAVRLSVVFALLSFLWRKKLWWLFPIVTILLIVGLLVLFAQGTGVAPFVYTIF